MPAVGGPVRQLTSDSGNQWPFGWSPDGERVTFAAHRGGFWNLWWVSRKTGEEKQLTDDRSLTAFARYPAWSPSGDSLVYEYGQTAGNIWMVANLP
jgi:Tol biopolymer transport system component